MRSATRGKRTNPVRVQNLPRFTLRKDQIPARYRSPLHIRRACASSAIDAMTINQCRGLALHHVPCPATNASTFDFHKLSLQILNHEFARTNTNYLIAGERRRRADLSLICSRTSSDTDAQHSPNERYR